MAEDERTTVDLGDGVRAVVVTIDPEDDDLPVGHRLEALEHDCIDLEDTGMGVVAAWPVNDESHQATFHQGLLTLRPAIACDLCGRHGQITDGAWEPVE